MKSLFLSINQPVTLENAFNDGSPVSVRFVNGWPCKTCGCLTEHDKVDGAQVCRVCGDALVPAVPIQVIEYKRFRKALWRCCVKIEFDAVKSEMQGVGRCTLDSYVQSRKQIHGEKVLEEIIANAKY